MLETCPSGQLLEIRGTGQRASHVERGARRIASGVPASPLPKAET